MRNDEYERDRFPVLRLSPATHCSPDQRIQSRAVISAPLWDSTQKTNIEILVEIWPSLRIVVHVAIEFALLK